MATTTMNNAAQENAQAAAEVNKMFDCKNFKTSIANLAKFGSGVFKKLVADIHDLSDMNDEEVRAEVSRTFKEAKEAVQEELNTLNMIPSFKDSYEAKTAEEALKNLMYFEKKLLAFKEVGIIRRSLIMFWTGVKAVAAIIVKSCIQAGKFVMVYGIRVLAVGLDFVIKVVKKAAGFLKTTWKAIKTIKVSGNKEQEVNPDETLTDAEEEVVITPEDEE